VPPNNNYNELSDVVGRRANKETKRRKTERTPKPEEEISEDRTVSLLDEFPSNNYQELTSVVRDGNKQVK